MVMQIGFHVEGHDHLIMHVLLARLLGVAEEDIEVDFIDALGRGWDFVLEMVPQALRRFYAKGARAALIGVDNDGELKIGRTGQREDPNHPRHWNHGEPASKACRWCELDRLVSKTRGELTWRTPGALWPVLIAVPVEMIKSWLLAAQAIVPAYAGQGLLQAESAGRAGQKQKFYGKPIPTKEDVKARALPLIRAMTPEHFSLLGQHSRSFRQLTEQVHAAQPAILEERAGA